MKDQQNPQGQLRHLARLSDGIFALAMAITFVGFELPEAIHPASYAEINHFLIEQLKSLGIYIITFVLVAFYWINHVQQFGYYCKTNETHLFIYSLYLMNLLVIPFSNDLVFRISSNAFAKIWFSANIFLIGSLSLISWIYATHQRRLVDLQLDSQTILAVKLKALVEPSCALLSMPIALLSPDFSDLVWLFVPISAPIINQVLKEHAKNTSFSQTAD